jgi:hypothetical protein
LVRKRETITELFTHEHVWHTPTKETIWHLSNYTKQ